MNENQNQPDKINPPPREAILVIVISYFFFVFLTLLLTAVLGSPADMSKFSSTGQKWVLLFGEMSLGVIPYLYFRKKQLPVGKMIRWDSIPSTIFRMIIPIGLSATIISDEIDRLIQLVLPRSPEAEAAIAAVMKANSGGEMVLLILSAVVVAALVEEALFRGFLQRALEKHINVTRAVVYGSLIWTLFHLSPFSLTQAIPIFLFGFLLGYFSWRTKSILPSIICHGINNGIALLFYNIDSEGWLTFYEWRGHVSPLFLLPAIIILYKGVQYIDEFYRSESFASSSTTNSSD